jgi:hypothetical protein
MASYSKLALLYLLKNNSLPNAPFGECMKVLHDNTSTRWESIQFHVFDAPTQHHLVYEDRIQLLKKALQGFPCVHLIPSIQCNGKEDLLGKLQQYTSGIILRTPKSFYYTRGSLYSLNPRQTGKALVVAKDSKSLWCQLYVLSYLSHIFSGPMEVSSLCLLFHPLRNIPSSVFTMIN